MIYVDSSVFLAQLLAEARRPDPSFWRQESIISSRLLEYESWTKINSLGLARSHGDDARALFRGISLLELTPPILARALDPFPAPVRTLDALHLASIEFLRGIGQRPTLATYDRRLSGAAASLSIATVEP
ncbi:MAG: PIN domain-containing protein [Candidatus Limnocylindrales bacterium]